MRAFLGLVSVLAVVIAGCKVPHTGALPPAQMLMAPGPGVGGPGPGVMSPVWQGSMPCPMPTSQVHFVGPDGMSVQWDVSAPGVFDSPMLSAPGRQEFTQAAIYRLKLTNVPGRPGVELYPTLEVAPALPRTEAFLAHNAIPVVFTESDLDQVLSGNFVTKVIYLPDPNFQQLALAGVETLVSTRLDPGVDPIAEADRRGAILAVIRVGNKDLEVPGARNQMNTIQPASFNSPVGVPMGAPVGNPAVPGAPTAFVAGMNSPQYGMPMSGTPIGLVGPPHIPLGVPAGLQRHTIVNHTNVHLPHPNERVRIDVKQHPGISYPSPANHVWLNEHVGTAHAALGGPHVPCRGQNCVPVAVGDPGPAAPGAPCPVPMQASE